MVIKAVIFDIGGVLTNDVWESMLLEKEAGFVVADDFDREKIQGVGGELWEAFAYRNLDEKDGWKILEREYWLKASERLPLALSVDECIARTDDFIEPLPGMIQLLGQLKKKGLGLAICSNNTEYWFERQAQKLRLGEYFDADKLALSSRVGVSKSSPNFEMFETAVTALNVKPQECIFIDDRANNVERALQFGIVGILFPSHSTYGAKYLKTILNKMGVV